MVGLHGINNQPSSLNVRNQSGENGNVVSADYCGKSAHIPKEMLVTATLEDLGGKTKQILRHVGFPDAENLEGARMGWSTSFDKLARALK